MNTSADRGTAEEMHPDEIIELLGLTPLADEGGMWSQVLLDEYSSAIYYLLAGDDFSALHRLPHPEIYHHYAGDRYPFVERSIRTARIAFPIPAGSAGPIEVLIRARNKTTHSMNFAALVWPADAWQSHLLTLRAWYGAFLGAVLMIDRHDHGNVLLPVHRANGAPGIPNHGDRIRDRRAWLR